VALDESAEDVREFTEGITYPVLLDREHTLSETYAITNVPTIIWIDEDDRIVRPNAPAPGTDLFIDFTGISSEPTKDAVRRWVTTGEVDLTPKEARAAVDDLTPELEEARLRFRLGAHLHRIGEQEAATRQLLAATDLAPDDLTIWRAALPLLGDDPFGPTFFEKWDAWKARGLPYNGLGPIT